MHLLEHLIQVVKYLSIINNLWDFGERMLFDPACTLPWLLGLDHLIDLLGKIDLFGSLTLVQEVLPHLSRGEFFIMALGHPTFFTPPLVELGLSWLREPVPCSAKTVDELLCMQRGILLSPILDLIKDVEND